MASPPPAALWEERCPKVGLNHQQIYGSYKYCAQCYAINPNPPSSQITRHSSVAPSYRSEPNPLLSTLIPTRRSVPPLPIAPAQRFGQLPSRAESVRQQGFKNRQPPSRNAGSKALSHKSTTENIKQSESEKRYAVEVQIYLSELELPAPDNVLGSLPRRKHIERHSEPFLNH